MTAGKNRPSNAADGHPHADAANMAEFASPACYAHEMDPNYMFAQPVLQGEELLVLLNNLLEAERAGAKTIAFYLKQLPESTLRDVLAAVGIDEGRYVALLRRLVLQLGGQPSTATGSFFVKATSIEGWPERLAFLDRGQSWVARKLDEALPRLRDPDILAALREMRDTHRSNIARCADLAPAG